MSRRAIDYAGHIAFPIHFCEGILASDDLGSTGALLDLVGDIYDAAIEPTKWPVACERLGRLVGGMQTAIALHDTVSHQVSLSASWNVDPALEEAMKANFMVMPCTISIMTRDSAGVMA